MSEVPPGRRSDQKAADYESDEFTGFMPNCLADATIDPKYGLTVEKR